MAKVDIFGTYHLDRPKKVEEELREFSSEADVFFTEAPREEPDQSDWNILLLRNPAVFIAGRFLNFFWQTAGFLFTRQFNTVDSVVTRRIAQDRDLEMVPVDSSVVKSASEVNRLLTAFSWTWTALIGVVLAFAFSLWPKILLVYGVPLSPVFFGLFAVLMGFIPIVPLARLTLAERNDVIADNIEEVLEEQSDATIGCLVVGHKHIGGVVKALEESSVKVNKTHKPKFFRRSL